MEDPATGAAAAAFGGYLRTLGLVTAPATVTIRQGEDMGRPSDLRVDVSRGPPHAGHGPGGPDRADPSPATRPLPRRLGRLFPGRPSRRRSRPGSPPGRGSRRGRRRTFNLRKVNQSTYG
ncbi:PhzF family phenazine biosynthesis protein [Streptomyces stelliscabiei]|uniref:PhzF family phenazine biosynthesis protein n=1 Tax=Streptomyces stelliscabiei TaxID=146820 RepID=UPI002FF2A3BC